jgi:hypothetical protein
MTFPRCLNKRNFKTELEKTPITYFYNNPLSEVIGIYGIHIRAKRL